MNLAWKACCKSLLYVQSIGHSQLDPVVIHRRTEHTYLVPQDSPLR